MTQRLRLRAALALATAGTLLAGVTTAGASTPAAPTQAREVITVERTAKHGLAALALIGKVRADKVPGFFAEADRTKNGSHLHSILDFNGTSGLTKYGHGGEEPLCGTTMVCTLDLQTNTLTFSLTITDDADGADEWRGVTRYLVLEGSKIDVTYAAVGFKVTRKAKATFARVSREQADADGVGLNSGGVEVFRAAQLPGGSRGSFAVLQLPCDGNGAGAATFGATGDTLPVLVNCSADPAPSLYVGPTGGGISAYGGQQGLYSREAGAGTQWQVSGAVSGISNTSTRLFVLSY